MLSWAWRVPMRCKTEAAAEKLQFEAVGWVAENRVDHSLRDPNNEQQQRECALSRTTNAQDPMHGKRPFPWPQQLPQLKLHEEPQQPFLRITWNKQTSLLSVDS